MTTLVQIPFKNTTISATNENGGVWVALRHLCETLGVNPESERQKLSRKSWATTCKMQAVGADGKNREILMMDRRTMTMWLGTLDELRVKDSARTLLVHFQKQAADALDAYFHDGGAINPRATDAQRAGLLSEIQQQGQVLQVLSSFLSPKFLESKAQILAARALGEEPEIHPLDMPLHSEDYLKEKGLKEQEIKSARSYFGRRISKAYQDHHGQKPEKATHEVNGSIRSINAYTERDRPLFDQVWEQHYADLYEPSLMEELGDE